jgi:hypothetical protein
MIDTLALVGVVLTCTYFLGLGAVALLVPGQAKRFLLGFARTARAHYAEMLMRLVIGGSLVGYGPHMFAAHAVGLFGWVILVTTAGLLLLPWRWHHRFAQRVVPPATRYITVIGWCSLALGGLLLAALVRGAAA